ncbi:MAG: glutamate 5-kinase, partial [Planctomycetota bacterium]
LALVSGEKSALGSGGMASKLQAMSAATKAGGIGVIANARTPRVLQRVLAGEQFGTVFLPAPRRMKSRARWIGHAARSRGQIVVDHGAAQALLQRGKSLLPSGITAVKGRFDKGAPVTVVDADRRRIARGLTNYSAEQIDRIKGLRSNQIAQVLGEHPYDEVIHRDNLALV